MAELDFSRVRLLPGFTPQRVTLPSAGVTVDDDRGLRSFEISASGGTIRVVMGRRGWECRGQKEVLIGYGLISEAWLPGAPGNNKGMQSVLFLPDGQVALGNWKGGLPRGYPFLQIFRNLGESFKVLLPYTEAEQVERDNFRSAWLEQKTQEETAKAAQDAWQKAQKARDPGEEFADRWRSGISRELREVALSVRV